MANDSTNTNVLLELAAAGDQRALGQLLTRFHDRLSTIVRLRMDPRLKGRLDPADVLQEAFIEATERFEEYARTRPMPFFLWLRFITVQRLMMLHRHHVEAQMRSADREVALAPALGPEASSLALADQLMQETATPSQKAAKAELNGLLQQALESMDTTDREVLVLRHFEQLSNAEAAQTLGIREATASQRYIRALKKLKDILKNLPGGFTELRS